MIKISNLFSKTYQMNCIKKNIKKILDSKFYLNGRLQLGRHAKILILEKFRHKVNNPRL